MSLWSAVVVGIQAHGSEGGRCTGCLLQRSRTDPALGLRLIRELADRPTIDRLARRPGCIMLGAALPTAMYVHGQPVLGPIN